jgi:hypothetical protein
MAPRWVDLPEKSNISILATDSDSDVLFFYLNRRQRMLLVPIPFKVATDSARWSQEPMTSPPP